MKLVFGLGNPGKQYEKTRHNAGWIALDVLIEKYGYDQVKSDKSSQIYISKIKNEKVLFIKPLTFMNNSGNIVRELMNFYKVSLKDIIILHDEKDFPINKNQFKVNGSAAGHNGVKSVISNLSSENFLRYRIGVNSPPYNWLIIDWVLSKLSKEEIQSIIDSTLQNSDFIYDWIKDESFEKIMAKYN